MISVQNVSGGYPNHHVLKNISFTVQKGELFGILGPNGSGKTTLLKMISGLLLPSEGDIQIEDQALQAYTPKQLAKLVAVLPQVSSEFFAYTVKETVMLGRYAHQKGWFYSTNARDETIVQEAMTMTGMEKFQAKLLQELSGGERQRVFLAQALAQEPSILLLDEPTNHLDLSYQKDLLDQLKKWTIDRNMSVISIFHDVNLASLYCDRLLLLNEGEVEVLGDANTVLQEKNIVNVYETEIVKQPHPQVPQPQMLLLPDIYGSEGIVHRRFIKESEQRIEYQSPVPLKTIAMGVLSGGGMGWHQMIVSSVKEDNYNLGTIYTRFDDSVEKIFIENIVILQSVKQIWILIHATLTDPDFVELMASLATTRALAGKPAETIIIGATQTGNAFAWKDISEKIKHHIKAL